MGNIKIYSFLLLLCACNNDAPQALGTLERDRIAHSATVNEVIVQLPISPGSFVKAGDVLVKLDDSFQLAMVAKAQANVAETQANLAKLRKGAREEEIAAARANKQGANARLIQAEANYQRQLKIAKVDLTSADSVEKARAERDSALAIEQSAKEKLTELVKGTRDEDLLIAEAHLAAAQATLQGEQNKLEDLTITATRDGILDNLPWNLGERVTIGSPLAIVLAGEAPYARVYMPETYRANLTIGDKLNVQVDGREQLFSSTLRWISNEPAFTPYYALNQQERARLMYLAEVQLPSSAADLPSGLPAQVLLP
ncbi:HlyD family secretion protein [Paraglaciecola sp. L3A3]|uniref:HlyD family secretion protein n=1 Tax=Paraglaciecola sp. L3A3 TaxID=2686358 RepID=UPI00131DAFD9|nr:HlyD family efflux transporter periplasmic adaptor subunit [Paraglaciecola sp. L3A3]